MAKIFQDDLYLWLEDCLAHLPGVATDTYRAIWQKGVLRFSDQDIKPDLVDELSARLVCNALAEKQQLLIVLPDRAPHRGAFLFATALLLEGVKRIRDNVRGGQVLYFGSTIGIREHLGQVHLNDLYLNTVFPQARLQRDLQTKKLPAKGRQKSDDISPLNLPTVLCVYSPGDPVTVCKENKAIWFAVDCSGDIHIRWLVPLVQYAKQHNIPLIGWAQNPLSRVVKDFQSAGGRVFTWPAADNYQTLPPLGTPVAKGLQDLFGEIQVRPIQPVVIQDQKVGEFSRHVLQAYLALSKVTSIASSTRSGRLALGAIQIGWRYLHTIENLCVPLNLFEAESSSFWGITALTKTQEALDKYIEALRQWESSFYGQMVEVQRHLQDAHDYLRAQEPPLWNLLPTLCIDSPAEGGNSLFVFPSTANRKLFGLSLLAYHNITEDDLRQLGVRLISLRELYDILTLSPHQEPGDDARVMQALRGVSLTDFQWLYWLVGLPSSATIPYLDPVLRQHGLRIILYPYQIPLLKRRLAQWETMAYPNLTDCVRTVASFLNQPCSLVDAPHEPRLRLTETTEQVFVIPSETTAIRDEKGGLWEPFDPLEEFAVLMRADDDDSSPLVAPVPSSLSTGIADEGSLEFVEEAWRIEFDSGEYILLAPGDRVNVVIQTPDGSTTDERFISSLRPGDRIVFIYGQRKQSLLSLVISRVYRNPAVSLHVKLVERWQEDFATAYQQRRERTGYSLDDLFQEMKLKGSAISDSQPLRNWLRGETLRPLDPEDLRRLAEILDMEFVRQHYKRIHRAGGRIAGLHVSLSRRLNSWLSCEAPEMTARATEQDDIIDEELGLTFRDFRDSLAILRITAIKKEKGPFGKDMLGQLECEGEIDAPR